jgi:6-phosphofructo-2-kinase/fructose-2,6-biphosphatase
VQRDRLHGRWQYLFIESIVTDTAVLEQNYKYKMMYSPDYRDQDPEQVYQPFKFSPSGSHS